MNLLDTNAVDIDEAPFAAFEYNETKGGMDDHGREEELEEIEREAYEQSQTRTGKSQRSKNYTILEDQILIKAWSAVSLDACTGTSQTARRYWQRIEDQYFRIMKNYPNKTPRTFRSLQGVGRTSSLCAAVGQLAWSKYAMHLQVAPWSDTSPMYL